MPSPEYVTEEQRGAVNSQRLQEAILKGDEDAIDRINGSQEAPKKEKDEEK